MRENTLLINVVNFRNKKWGFIGTKTYYGSNLNTELPFIMPSG